MGSLGTIGLLGSDALEGRLWLSSFVRLLGDFTKQSYQPAALRKGYIAQLCAPFRALQADENPAHSGNFVPINRLSN